MINVIIKFNSLSKTDEELTFSDVLKTEETTMFYVMHTQNQKIKINPKSIHAIIEENAYQPPTKT